MTKKNHQKLNRNKQNYKKNNKNNSKYKMKSNKINIISLLFVVVCIIHKLTYKMFFNSFDKIKFMQILFLIFFFRFCLNELAKNINK